MTLFISACTFAVRWIVKPKPLVDNMLSVSRCYSSLNCINVAHGSRKLFVFLSNVCACICVGIHAFVYMCSVWVQALFRSFCFLIRNDCGNTFHLSILGKSILNRNSSWIWKVSAWAHNWSANKTLCLHYPPIFQPRDIYSIAAIQWDILHVAFKTYYTLKYVSSGF